MVLECFQLILSSTQALFQSAAYRNIRDSPRMVETAAGIVVAKQRSQTAFRLQTPSVLHKNYFEKEIEV
jgi:hypothetical protein